MEYDQNSIEEEFDTLAKAVAEIESTNDVNELASTDAASQQQQAVTEVTWSNVLDQEADSDDDDDVPLSALVNGRSPSSAISLPENDATPTAVQDVSNFLSNTVKNATETDQNVALLQERSKITDSVILPNDEEKHRMETMNIDMISTEGLIETTDLVPDRGQTKKELADVEKSIGQTHDDFNLHASNLVTDIDTDQKKPPVSLINDASGNEIASYFDSQTASANIMTPSATDGEINDYVNMQYGEDGYFYMQDKDGNWYYQADDGYIYPWSDEMVATGNDQQDEMTVDFPASSDMQLTQYYDENVGMHYSQMMGDQMSDMNDGFSASMPPFSDAASTFQDTAQSWSSNPTYYQPQMGPMPFTYAGGHGAAGFNSFYPGAGSVAPPPFMPFAGFIQDTTIVDSDTAGKKLTKKKKKRMKMQEISLPPGEPTKPLGNLQKKEFNAAPERPYEENYEMSEEKKSAAKSLLSKQLKIMKTVKNAMEQRKQEKTAMASLEKDKTTLNMEETVLILPETLGTELKTDKNKSLYGPEIPPLPPAQNENKTLVLLPDQSNHDKSYQKPLRDSKSKSPARKRSRSKGSHSRSKSRSRGDSRDRDRYSRRSGYDDHSRRYGAYDGRYSSRRSDYYEQQKRYHEHSHSSRKHDDSSRSSGKSGRRRDRDDDRKRKRSGGEDSRKKLESKDKIENVADKRSGSRDSLSKHESRENAVELKEKVENLSAKVNQKPTVSMEAYEPDRPGSSSSDDELNHGPTKPNSQQKEIISAMVDSVDNNVKLSSLDKENTIVVSTENDGDIQWPLFVCLETRTTPVLQFSVHPKQYESFLQLKENWDDEQLKLAHLKAQEKIDVSIPLENAKLHSVEGWVANAPLDPQQKWRPIGTSSQENVVSQASLTELSIKQIISTESLPVVYPVEPPSSAATATEELLIRSKLIARQRERLMQLEKDKEDVETGIIKQEQKFNTQEQTASKLKKKSRFDVKPSDVTFPNANSQKENRWDRRDEVPMEVGTSSEEETKVKQQSLTAVSLVPEHFPKKSKGMKSRNEDELERLRTEALASMEKAQRMLEQVEMLSKKREGEFADNKNDVALAEKENDRRKRKKMTKQKRKKQKKIILHDDDDDEQTSESEEDDVDKTKSKSAKQMKKKRRQINKKQRRKKIKQQKYVSESSEDDLDDDDDDDDDSVSPVPPKRKRKQSEKKRKKQKKKESKKSSKRKTKRKQKQRHKQQQRYDGENDDDEEESSNSSHESDDVGLRRKKTKDLSANLVDMSDKQKNHEKSRRKSSSKSSDDDTHRLAQHQQQHASQRHQVVTTEVSTSGSANGNRHQQRKSDTGGKQQRQIEPHKAYSNDSDGTSHKQPPSDCNATDDTSPPPPPPPTMPANPKQLPKKHAIHMLSDNPLLRNADLQLLADQEKLQAVIDHRESLKLKKKAEDESYLRNKSQTDTTNTDSRDGRTELPEPLLSAQKQSELANNSVHRASRVDLDSMLYDSIFLSEEEKKDLEKDRLRECERRNRQLDLPAVDDRRQYVKDYLEKSLTEKVAGTPERAPCDQQQMALLHSEFEGFEADLFSRGTENKNSGSADSSTKSKDMQLLKQLQSQASENMLQVIGKLKSALNKQGKLNMSAASGVFDDEMPTLPDIPLPDLRVPPPPPKRSRLVGNVVDKLKKAEETGSPPPPPPPKLPSLLLGNSSGPPCDPRMGASSNSSLPPSQQQQYFVTVATYRPVAPTPLTIRYPRH